ncbi:Ig-like domain-containing protein [uncultured Ruminococcus sp.]|uniref:Ig-like domain-containing protein n=1 Tax=uncultured Ruminococcus sp. TaxID=165186 RepID=UPI0025EAD4E7|nr:Ig-like domain-containing protein [uncultured Ruminococcus sp.]
MKKRILSIILTLTICVSAVAAASVNTCSAVSQGTGRVLPNEKPITLGVNEPYKQVLDVDAGNGDYVYVWTSNRSVFPDLSAMNSTPKVKYKVSNRRVILSLYPRQTGYADILCSTYKKSYWSDKDSWLKVTVKKAPAYISLNKTSITLGIGETFDLNSYVNSGAAAYSRPYSSSNSRVASVTKSGGLVTAKAVGTAKVTVKTYNGKTATCTVTVKKAPTKISLNKTNLTLKVGQTFDLNSYVNSGAAAYSRPYSSSNSRVASVTKSGGLVTAKSVGTAKITVKTFNGKTATCTVNVKKR